MKSILEFVLGLGGIWLLFGLALAVIPIILVSPIMIVCGLAALFDRLMEHHKEHLRSK